MSTHEWHRGGLVDPPDLAYDDGQDLFICSLRAGEKSRRAAVRLASSEHGVVLRIGGYSGNLPPDQSEHMLRTIVTPLHGCKITVIGGGTQMRYRGAPYNIRYGINEVLPLIAAHSPAAKVLGLVPRQNRLRLLRHGPLSGCLLISDKDRDEYVTIVHPDLGTCMLLQYTVDRGLPNWDEEWMVSLDYMEVLRTDAGFRSGHVFYGGGQTTEKEIRHVAALPHNPHNPWHIVLLADSGGAAQRFAEDTEFRRAYAHSLTVCTSAEFGSTIQNLGLLGPAQRR